MSDIKYTVQESAKAKHVRLKMSVQSGLVVVVPVSFDRDRILGLLERKADWIEKAVWKTEQQRKFFDPEPPGAMPERLALRAIGEEWSLDYRATGAPWVAAVERGGNRLLVYGDIGSDLACKEALKRWLNRKAHEHLVPWLEHLAQDKSFATHRVLVKSQRTRWASCSRHGSISINSKMLFIPPELVRYVFIHELCHTVHMNHSAHFWALVRQHVPRHKGLDEKLRIAWQLLPSWLASARNADTVPAPR